MRGEIANPMTDSAQKYAWHQLARLSGFPDSSLDFSSLGVTVNYRNLEHAPVNANLELTVIPCELQEWELALETQPSLDWVNPNQAAPTGVRLPFTNPLPVLFGKENFRKAGYFAKLLPDRRLVFSVDILAFTFFMLSRWEETILPDEDEHGRFPAQSALAVKAGFIDWPVVDQIGLLLQAWLKELLPDWQPEKRHFQVLLSHDIDVVAKFASNSDALRTFAGDLLKRRSLPAAFKTLNTALGSPASNNPYLESITTLADLSSKYHLQSAFYFMAAQRAPYDNGYDPNRSWLKPYFKDLHARGFEIGIHPGYHSFGNPNSIRIEKERLEKATGLPCYGGRQHYLRFRVPQTWRHWQIAGLDYDSTLTFASREGFRGGTSFPFHPYDLANDRPFTIIEKPLIVMDGTLKDYRGMKPQVGMQRMLELARRCEEVNGIFTLLWHNTSLIGEWQNWIPIYRATLRSLSSMTSRN